MAETKFTQRQKEKDGQDTMETDIIKLSMYLRNPLRLNGN